MSIKYKIIIEPFAESYYLKKFKKKYKKSFEVSWRGFEFMLQKFDLMLEKSYTNKICDLNDIVIFKTGFTIKPNESVKTSGNRCIIAQDILNKEIRVLLVYHKNDMSKSCGETQWFKQVIKENYPEFKNL